MNTVVEFKDVFKSYKKRDLSLRNPAASLRPRKVLKGLSFSIKRGEIFGLVGLNGQGKTTTLKLILGYIFPDSGEISVLGYSPGSVEAKRKISFLPENPPLYTTVKVSDIMKFASIMRLKVEEKKRKDEIFKLLEKVNLRYAYSMKVRELSRGMLQRLGLAQAFLGYPEFIILDEPLSGLDPLGRRMAKELIKEARNKGSTVLFTSHILEDIEEISDRVGILYKGKIVRFVTYEEIKREGDLEKIFLNTLKTYGD